MNTLFLKLSRPNGARCYRACEGRVVMTGESGGFGFDGQTFSLWSQRFEENHGFQHGTNLSTRRLECLWIISRAIPMSGGVVSLPTPLPIAGSTQISPSNDNITQIIDLVIDQPIKTHCHRVIFFDFFHPPFNVLYYSLHPF